MANTDGRHGRTAPETHPKYRPPVDLPPLNLGSPSPSRSTCGPLPPDLRYRFVVSNLLDRSECAELVAAAESHNPTKVDWEYDPSYRDCSRVVLRSRPLADAVYSRLLPLLSSAECESVRPFGFDGGGEWRPFKANEVVRVSRYDPGGHFDRHRDGAFVENDDVRSVYTVLVYLNEAPEFEGGTTRVFLPPPDDDDDDAEAGGGGGDDAVPSSFADVIPRTGSALVMTHDTFHTGRVVTAGRKYVARFDLMFRRLGGSMTPSELSELPDRALAERLYESSVVKQRNGDPGGSTEDYVRALNIQAKLPSSGGGSSSATTKRRAGDDALSDTLDENSFVEVLRFLEPRDIMRASETSRNWRSVCSAGLLWRELFLLRWPALSSAESTVLRDADVQRLPSARYEDPTTVEGRHRRRLLFTAFVAVLRRKKECNGITFDAESQAKLKKELYGGQRDGLPDGYMFSSINMTKDLDIVALRDGTIGWKRFHACVRHGTIHFAEFDELAEKREASRGYTWRRRGKKEAYDASKDADIDVPPPIPIEHDTELSFSFGSVGSERARNNVDKFIVKLPGTDRAYLAVCTHDPRNKDPPEVYWGTPTFGTGLLEDVARVVVARQTEGALRYGNVSVKCDAKTKQWRAAYARRHIAERYFDVVTIDVGQKRTKFAANATVEDALLSDRDWWAGRVMRSDGSFASQVEAARDFFQKAAGKYLSDETVHSWDAGSVLGAGIVIPRQLFPHAASLVGRAMDDPELRPSIPPALSEAHRGCGSFASAIRHNMGHLWSAGHGLRNHDVGDACLGDDQAATPFGAGDSGSPSRPDVDVMAVLCAHVVERTFARRAHRINHFIRVTCAEHPVNVVEPALGFTEEVKTRLTRALASFQVPFVGFVNGAVAALTCGKEPRRDGIVVMLGGANSAAVRVVDGVADVANGILLRCCVGEGVPDDPGAVAEEAYSAIQRLLLASGDDARADDPLIPVLLTGGRASDAVVDELKNLTMYCHFYTASREGERHLDSARGAHILANLSDGRKYFRTALHLMWSLNGDDSAISGDH